MNLGLFHLWGRGHISQVNGKILAENKTELLTGVDRRRKSKGRKNGGRALHPIPAGPLQAWAGFQADESASKLLSKQTPYSRS